MAKSIGTFTFVLHSHLPYVLSHGQWPHGMDWLYECAFGSYLPLLDASRRLTDEGLPPKFTLGVTPVLCEMLASPTFKAGFPGYLENRIQASDENIGELIRTGQDDLAPLAEMWRDVFTQAKTDFEERWDRDVLAGFRDLQDENALEIITCGATHGYFPLLSEDVSVQAQVKCGIRTYERHFGRKPSGMWLPECAYRPAYSWKSPLNGDASEKPRKGVEEFLSENGISYFIIDSHLLKGGKAIGVYLDRFEGLKLLWSQYEKAYGPFEDEEGDRSPYEIHLLGGGGAQKPVAVLTRDPETGLKVWSREVGYPGDGGYLDFHKKQFPSGNRYWRVTDAKADLAEKEVYDPALAQSRIAPHAMHFNQTVYDVLTHYEKENGKPGFICAPFDTELFGHWWYEGPRWLEHVVRGIYQTDGIEVVTGSEQMQSDPPKRMVEIPEGSWGEGGYHYIWLNDVNKWTWKHVYEAEETLHDLAGRLSENPSPDIQRLLRQLARENLLLQSSDWQFLISTFAAKDYAELRLDFHAEACVRLAALIKRLDSGESLSEGDWVWVEEVEKRDCIFEDIDVSWWAKVEYPAE